MRPPDLSPRLSCFLCGIVLYNHRSSTQTDKFCGWGAIRVGDVDAGSPVPVCSTRLRFQNPATPPSVYWVGVALSHHTSPPDPRGAPNNSWWKKSVDVPRYLMGLFPVLVWLIKGRRGWHHRRLSSISPPRVRARTRRLSEKLNFPSSYLLRATEVGMSLFGSCNFCE